MPVSIEKLVEAALHRAAYDRTFREKLLASPAEAIAEAFGAPVPAAAHLRFVEHGPAGDSTYVLPPLASDDEELSDEELDAAAGGSDDWFSEGTGEPGGGGS